MSEENDFFIYSFRIRFSAPNDPVVHQSRVDAARAAMGTKYLCHPDNRVRKAWGGPARVGK